MLRPCPCNGEAAVSSAETERHAHSCVHMQASEVPLRIKPVVPAATGTAPAVAPAPAAQLPSAASAKKQVSVALPSLDDDIDVGPARVDQTPKKVKPAQLKLTAAQAASDQGCDVSATATDAGRQTCPAAAKASASSLHDTTATGASASPSAEAPVSPLAGMNTRVPSKVVRNLSAPALVRLAGPAALPAAPSNLHRFACPAAPPFPWTFSSFHKPSKLPAIHPPLFPSPADAG